MSSDSQLNDNWKTIPGCTGTVYISNPHAKDWILLHAPDIPAFQHLKNKLIVNTESQNSESPRVVPDKLNTTKRRLSVSHSESMNLNQAEISSSKENLRQLETTNLIDASQALTAGSNTETITNKQRKLDTNQINKPVTNTRPRRLLPSLGRKMEQAVEKTSFYQSPSTSQITQVNQVHQPNLSASPRRTLPSFAGTKNQTAMRYPASIPVLKIAESNTLYEALSPEQKNVHTFVIQEKKNVFFTGSAGTGKSFLLRSIIMTLKTQLLPIQIAITASTGVAAINISGITIHSFAGVALGDQAAEVYVSEIMRKPTKLKTLREVKVLVVDEISMIDATLLDKIDFILKKIRGAITPFGGLQVIFCGDFFQLPPINKEGNTVLAYKAKCWDNAIHKTFLLKTPFRQRDQTFVNMLNEIRVGNISEETLTVFQNLSRPLKIDSNIVPTELYSLRNQVDKANDTRLSELVGEEVVFVAQDSGYNSSILLKHCMAPKELILKVGAQVMLLKNLTSSLVNGSIGVIEKFVLSKTNQKSPLVLFSNGEKRMLFREEWSIENKGETVASRKQFPLMLAWAISIHKSQGQTIDWLKVDLKNVFVEGQAYVALSRGISIDKMQVLNFDKKRVRANKDVVAFYEGIE